MAVLLVHVTSARVRMHNIMRLLMCVYANTVWLASVVQWLGP